MNDRILTETSCGPNFLFVYGSLCTGLPCPRQVRALIDGGTKLFDANATLDGDLVHLGLYPGLIPPRNEHHGHVSGEVLEVVPDTAFSLLAALDVYEGCGPKSPMPHEYRRARRVATLRTGVTLEVWVYIYALASGTLPHVPGGDWRRFLKEAGRAPRPVPFTRPVTRVQQDDQTGNQARQPAD